MKRRITSLVESGELRVESENSKNNVLVRKSNAFMQNNSQLLTLNSQLALLFALILSSCATFKATAPEGFAEYEDNGKFRAISSDGVLYRVSEYEQKSEASLDFWKEAFLLKMKNSNYKQEDSLNVSIGGKPAIGYVFSFATNTGSDLYLVAAVPVKNKMLVVEATAESEKFKVRQSNILEAIGKISLP